MLSYFKVDQPSMAMNDVRVLDHWLQFTNTRRVEATDPVYDLFHDAASIMNGWQQDGATNISLVINCHGIVISDDGDADVGVGGLQLGTGVTPQTVTCFQSIRPYVQTIYLMSCDSAHGSSGENFCRAVATAAHAIVYGAESPQGCESLTPSQFPPSSVPAYTGNIKIFSKDGVMTYCGPSQQATFRAPNAAGQ
jgi:hypothetical protein